MGSILEATNVDLNKTIQTLLPAAVRLYIQDETNNFLANVTRSSIETTNPQYVTAQFGAAAAESFRQDPMVATPINYNIGANLSTIGRLEAADQIDAQAQSQFEQNLDMATWERVFWCFLFFSMVLVAASGNMIVVYIVSTNKEMKSVTNYFLVNLSVADTMVSLLNVTFNFISMLIG